MTGFFCAGLFSSMLYDKNSLLRELVKVKPY